MEFLKKLPLAWVIGSGGALLLGLLAGPVFLYWAGGKVAGAYGDPGGLLVLWSSIYADAASLGGAGLVFLFGPLVMFQMAWLGLWVLKNYAR